MPDRIIYLVDTVTKPMASSGLEFVDDAALAELLGDGWETSTTIPGKSVKVGSKMVKATMIFLKQAADNRGLSTRDERDDRGGRAGSREVVVITDEYGRERSMAPGAAMVHAITRALANVGDTGHLGGARNHSMPGLQIISGEMMSKAYDMGQLAMRSGKDVDACPFQEGSEPHQRWLRGYRDCERGDTQKLTEAAAAVAEQEGLNTARGYGPKDVVSCPYPRSSPAYEHWLRGFKQGGGTVE